MNSIVLDDQYQSIDSINQLQCVVLVIEVGIKIQRMVPDEFIFSMTPEDHLEELLGTCSGTVRGP